MTSKEKSVKKEVEAAKAAYREKYGNKPTEPYYRNGKFVDALVNGDYPLTIFLNGFYRGVDYANTHNSIKKRATENRK